MINDLYALDICFAVQTGDWDKAKASFTEMLSHADDKVFLQSVHDALVTSCRRHNKEIFLTWLIEAQARFITVIGKNNEPEACCRVLYALSFAACDNRLEAALPLLQRLLKKWLRKQEADSAFIRYFWTEWLTMAAQIARRGWRNETGWIMRLLIWWVYKQPLKEWQLVLQQLAMHFVVHAKWDGFTNACNAFKELLYFYLLLLRRAENKKLALAERSDYLLLAVRNIRDVIANSARNAMTEDMDIFREWYKFLWKISTENENKKQRLRLLLQLAIVYWQNTRTKTSRKQAKFLNDLLSPNLITEEYKKLLQYIC